jgi:hypothetical protein
MDLRTTERIEAAIDGTAAMLFAGAAAYALMRGSGSPSPALAGAGVAFLGSLLVLRAIRPPERIFAIAGFNVEPAAVGELDELVLGNCDRVGKPAADELVLDDVLADPEPDSRVVRLFDPAAMPADSPGFDRQFSGARAVPPPPDASRALHEALAKLRHSLR